MKFVLPVILLVVGVGAGVGAGLATQKPAEHVEIHPCGDGTDASSTEITETKQEPTAAEIANREFVKLNNQFVVPVVKDEVVVSLVVISLSLEVEAGQKEVVFTREPKLRDAFLQDMFDHANLGGFSGSFTDTLTLEQLRRMLLETSVEILGEAVTDVLIQDIARQDV